MTARKSQQHLKHYSPYRRRSEKRAEKFRSRLVKFVFEAIGPKLRKFMGKPKTKFGDFMKITKVPG